MVSTYRIDMSDFTAPELAIIARLFWDSVTAGSSDIARDADYLLCANVGKHTARLLDGAASDAIDAVRKYDASL